MERRKCFSYHKVGHLKKKCPEKNKKPQDQNDADAAIAEEGYESAEVLSISENKISQE